jgi:SAM-dependent methyltransferase
MNRFDLMYRLGFAPWERRDVEQTWRPVLEGPDALSHGRALDVGCGSGRDAVHLARHGWQVTGVDFADTGLKAARQRALEEGVEVQWVKGDVAKLGGLGLASGYDLLYDFGCMHLLPDAGRRGLARGLGDLAAGAATLLIGAFMAGRRIFLPRGIDEDELVTLLGDDWALRGKQTEVTDEMPAPIRRAEPTLYRLVRHA